MIQTTVGDITILDKTFTRLLTSCEIGSAIQEMAGKMNKDLNDEEVVFLVVLNGAFMFAADLLREIIFQPQVSFIRLASYEGISSTGEVRTLIGLQEDLEKKVVVVIEDIIDSGLTIENIHDQLKPHRPQMVSSATLLFKPESYRLNIEPDYVGFRIPSRFVIGYGLDYNGFGRNLADIYIESEK